MNVKLNAFEETWRKDLFPASQMTPEQSLGKVGGPDSTTDQGGNRR